MSNIKQIQKPVGSLEILVHLHRNKKATVTELIREAGLNQRTTYNALERLQENGLIMQDESGTFPVCKKMSATPAANDLK